MSAELFPTAIWVHADDEECEESPCQQPYHQLRNTGSPVRRRMEDGSEDAAAPDASTNAASTTATG